MLNVGDKLWNGVIVTAPLASTYNALTEKIAAIERSGRAVPEHLLNGRHNLLNGAHK